MLLAAIAVNAQQITVKGVRVTDTNNDVLGDGKVKFDKSTNTLTFTDADITYDQSIIEVISTWKESLNIKFEGKNTFTTTGNNSCIILGCKQQEVKLWSDEYTKGSLTINVTDETDGDQGINNLGHNNITLLRLDLMINVPRTDGIGPLNSSATVEKLTIDKCNVAIKAGRAALRFKEVELIDSHYQEGYAINGEKTSGCTYDGVVMKEVKVDEDIYGVWVAGKQVTAKIKHNILIDEAPSYTMAFEPKTNELTLDNVNLNVDSKNAIWVNNESSSRKVFMMRLIGNNTITSSVVDEKTILLEPVNADSVLVYSVAGGSLDVTSPSNYATLASSQPLAIKDCTVNIKNNSSAAPAFMGRRYSFINASFSAETAGDNVFRNVQTLKYYGCFMSTPTDGFINSGETLSSKIDKKKFVVVPGVDNVKPNFYYGDTPEVKSLTHNSVVISFLSAMDNFSYQYKIRYSVKVAKADEPEVWVQDYDLNIAASGSQLQTEIADLDPATKYIVRLKAMDEAGNYDYYKDVEVTTIEDPAGIDAVVTDASDAKIYNAAGIQVGKDYRGMKITNGKKYCK